MSMTNSLNMPAKESPENLVYSDTVRYYILLQTNGAGYLLVPLMKSITKSYRRGKAFQFVSRCLSLG